MTKDGKLVLIEKAVRTVPYGFLGVLFSVYLSSEFHLDAFLIGVVLALTVASSAIYTLVASVFADRLGRKRTLIFFALTDAVAGALLFSSDSLWAPVAAGIIGNMTVGAGEVGPFLTLEQAILPGVSDSRRRTLGFSGISILSYYFYEKYSLQLSSLGLLFAGTQIVTAISFLFAERIARQIGLIRTMVYTHIPSNLLLAIIPFVSSAPIAVGLLLSRQSLSQMDVPTRQSYLMSVVPEADRTPAAGFTNVSRSIAQTPSPSLAGYAIAALWLGAPFVIAGGLKLTYDLSLYKIFHRLKPPQESKTTG